MQDCCWTITINCNVTRKMVYLSQIDLHCCILIDFTSIALSQLLHWPQRRSINARMFCTNEFECIDATMALTQGIASLLLMILFWNACKIVVALSRLIAMSQETHYQKRNIYPSLNCTLYRLISWLIALSYVNHDCKVNVDSTFTMIRKKYLWMH